MHRPNTLRATERSSGSRIALRATVFFMLAAVVMLPMARPAAASILSLFAPNASASTQADADTRRAPEPDNSQTVQLLHAARNVDPNGSRGGGNIATVDGVALAAEPSPFSASTDEEAPKAGADQISLYLVQTGDTLSQVATMFSVSVNTIVWANQLSSSKDIHPGQTLLILPISGVQHTVAKGETLGDIAKNYGGDAQEILAYNGLASEKDLHAGDTVTIPGGEMPVPKAATPSAKSHSSSAGSTGLTEPIHTGTGMPGLKVASGPSIPGYFIDPLPGSIKTQGLHGYNAVDLSDGKDGVTPVLAAARGRVIVSRVGGWNGGYGNYVVIDHPNGTQTLYGHLAKNLVWQGQSVVQGQIIGYEGNTGRTTGPHLHFEVRGAANPFR